MVKYRIKWKNGQPYVEAGKVVLVGTKRPQKRVKYPSENRLMTDGKESILEALEDDIINLCCIFGPAFYPHQHKQQPWDLAYCITQILRLKRKLERHNLV